MSFTTLGLIEPILRSLQELGYTEASPIQTQAIPAILAQKNLLASAQTGTGKTASFVLPILQQLSTKPQVRSNRTRALILTPTRELAAQVHESIKRYSRYLPLRSTAVYGGMKINPQMMKLRSGVEILVATPGRLMDLFQQNAIKFEDVETVVLDEADRMLDMGFIHAIKRIINLLPEKRQTLLFSATFSKEIRNLVKDVLVNPFEINVSPQQTTVTSIQQTIHPVDKALKSGLLSHLIHEQKWGQTLVFSRTKHGANQLVKKLSKDRLHAAAIHGDKTQAQRNKVLADFKAGKIHVLVATDIASRGIDIEQLPCVVNFDLPLCAEDYVHRIGRTGRAGASGLAISLVSADEAPLLYAIERLIKQKLDRVEIENFEPTENFPSESSHQMRTHGFSKNHRASAKKSYWNKKKSNNPYGSKKDTFAPRSAEKKRHF